MKKQLLKIAPAVILLTLFLSSCVNLKPINDFPASSLKSIKIFEDIKYGFNQNCLDNCQFKKIIDLDLNANNCDCVLNEKADSVTFLIYTTVHGYLDGLSNLSKNNLTGYKTDALTKALKEDNFGSIKIDKVQGEAYNKISNILLKAFTDGYRKRKIKTYVKEANEPLKVLLTYLNFNLSENLAGKLNVQKQRIKSYYFDLTNDKTLSAYEKTKAVEEYYHKLSQIETKQNELVLYSKLLTKIGNGHQKLVENIESSNKKEAGKLLIQYAGDLQDIISAFNKLKI